MKRRLLCGNTTRRFSQAHLTTCTQTTQLPLVALPELDGKEWHLRDSNAMQRRVHPVQRPKTTYNHTRAGAQART